MDNYLTGAVLKQVHRDPEVSLYHIDSTHLLNQYYIASYEGSRRLMMRPEEVGFQTYIDTMPPTVATLRYLKKQGLNCSMDILTILRGGLNYSMEESCFKAGLQVNNINFLSCERIIRDKKIVGLDIKYQKYNIVDNGTMLIGDIIASGETLRMCFEYLLDKYRKRGAKLRRVIFFTIGGTKAFSLLEDFTTKIREYWPEFEGFTCIFYEGAFSVYDTKGVTGINVPDIDFYWKGGIISPEFKQAVLDTNYAIFEKCIIYDGGARRYEIPEHYEEVMDYWNDVRHVADNVNMRAFTDEKIGYPEPKDYEEWLALNHYADNTIESNDDSEAPSLPQVYKAEQLFRQKAYKYRLYQIACVRLQEVESALRKYLK